MAAADPGGVGAQRPRLRAVWRLEHRAFGAGHQELEVQPEEFRLPAGGARLAQRPLRRPRPDHRCHRRRGWADAYRLLNPTGEDYTWWSNRGAARANNVGWRIDYQFITPGLRDRLRSCSIYRDERFSDHAPFTVDYDL